MDNKGQVGVGLILMTAIALIVGAIFVPIIAQQLSTSTDTVAVANQSETLAANSASIYIEEYRALSSVVILNATDDVTIGDGNYTITNNVIHPTTGALSVKVTTDDAEFASNAVKVSGTAQPLTYTSDAGARAVISIIVIMFALAVAVVALEPTLRSGLGKMFGR